jgi:hypothetical protein
MQNYNLKKIKTKNNQNKCEPQLEKMCKVRKHKNLAKWMWAIELNNLSRVKFT